LDAASRTYDARGALTALSAQSDFNWPTPTVTGPYANFLWPDAGWTVSATHPQSASCRYGYDPLGRLVAVNPDTLPSSGADARYTYDAVGNLHSTSYRNAVATTYTFNPRNWLRCLTSVLGAVVVASFDYDGALAAPGQPWLAETRLSPTGQRRAMMETVGTATRTVAYGYDLLSRLTKEDIQSATAGPAALVAYDGTGTGQGYDRVGNRRSRQVTGTLPGVSAYAGDTFNLRDLLNPNPQTGYTYDLNGNTTQEPGGTLYAYDAENRLVKVTKPDGTTITLAYDADGNRVKKVVDAPGTANDSTTLYLVDDRNPTGYAQVVEERDGAGATTVTYTYGLDLVCQRRGVMVSYYGYDGLGSVRYLTDETGAVTDTYTYDAFGIQVASTGTTPNAYRYTGEQWDGDLGFYYLRARYYQPQLGRFWTMDSYEGNQSDPLSLHKYLYCHGDPANNWDPSGHIKISPSILRMLKGFALRAAGIDAAIRLLVGIRVGQVLGEAYVREVNPQAVVNHQIGTLDTVEPERWLDFFKWRPDILDHEARSVFEVKPDNAVGIALGIVEVADDIRSLKQRYPNRVYRPGRWSPSANPYSVVGLPGISGISFSVTARDAGAGVIAYEIHPNPEVLSTLISAAYEVVKGLRNVALANRANIENGTQIGTLTTMLGGFAF
jgi:RHS repeat-associated protein